jgi:hypothetical protein
VNFTASFDVKQSEKVKPRKLKAQETNLLFVHSGAEHKRGGDGFSASICLSESQTKFTFMFIHFIRAFTPCLNTNKLQEKKKRVAVIVITNIFF